MKLGLMQPYFFPYLGHFQLIARVDRWIAYDTAQYSKQSWINRNRILHPTRGWQYVTAPIHASEFPPITEVRLVDKKLLANRMGGQIDHYRGRAPYFENVKRLVDQVFEATSSDRLAELNINGLSLCCKYLGIGFESTFLSSLNLGKIEAATPGGRVLRICEMVGADHYVNPASGSSLYEPDEWKTAGVRLEFLNPLSFQYDCTPYQFVAGLSILDVLMWNTPQSVTEAINKANAQIDA